MGVTGGSSSCVKQLTRALLQLDLPTTLSPPHLCPMPSELPLHCLLAYTQLLQLSVLLPAGNLFHILLSCMTLTEVLVSVNNSRHTCRPTLGFQVFIGNITVPRMVWEMIDECPD